MPPAKAHGEREGSVEKVEYYGWPNCLCLRNGLAEVIVTTDIGPRVIHFGLVDGDNVFKVIGEEAGLVGGDRWRLYGGHRLWHAPEVASRTYVPDNGPVEVAEWEGVMILTQPTEATTGIQKQIMLSMAPDEARVTVTHRLYNRSLWAVELAPWALSVMAPGGVGIIPLPPRGPHQENLLPTSAAVMWAYTDLSDPRWVWGRQYVLARQDPAAQAEQKIGLTHTQGWLAYVRAGVMFVKSFVRAPGAAYPDLGSSAEVYTDANFMELETLGPLTRVEPGGFVEHVEQWHLAADVPTPSTEAEVGRFVLPRIRQLGL